MGHTHYWQHKHDFTQRQFDLIVADFTKLLPWIEDLGIVLAGWDGTGKPEINSDTIRFNGLSSDDNAYETFSLRRGSVDFDFCKTARKPYDLAVQLCLIIAEEYSAGKFGNVIVRSDGGMSDWRPAIDMCIAEFGYGINFRLRKG